MNKIHSYLQNKLSSLDIVLTTPGALSAWLHGCYLNLYKVVKDLDAMGMKPQTIIDIGASTGMFTKCAHHVFPAASLYAFEPLQESYRLLASMSKSISQLRCYNVAIGSANHAAVIHRSTYEYSSSLMPMGEIHKAAFPYTSGATDEPVEVRTLDSMMDAEVITPPLLMKIDVQGYESHVLQGAKNTLRSTSTLICEMSFKPLYNGQPLFDEVYDQLRDLGFSFMGPVGELRHPSTREVLQIDGLFVRQSPTM